MANRVYESMTRVPLVEYAPAVRRGWNPKILGCVRVWRSEASLEAAANPDRTDIFAAVESVGPDATPLAIIAELEKLDRIAAIEVLDADGNGVLLYPDWA